MCNRCRAQRKKFRALREQRRQEREQLERAAAAARQPAPPVPPPTAERDAYLQIVREETRKALVTKEGLDAIMEQFSRAVIGLMRAETHVLNTTVLPMRVTENVKPFWGETKLRTFTFPLTPGEFNAKMKPVILAMERKTLRHLPVELLRECRFILNTEKVMHGWIDLPNQGKPEELHVTGLNVAPVFLSKKSYVKVNL